MRTNAPIVVATDGSPTAAVAVRWAAREAELHRHSLRIVVVVEFVNEFLPGLEMVPSVDQTYEQELREMLAESEDLARAIAGDGIDVSSALLRGPVVPLLVTESKAAAMIVVGSRGRGAFSRLLLGSVTSAVTRHAHCPVAVIRDETPDLAQKPILVGVDGTANSEPAIAFAMQEASLRGVPVRAVYAWSDVSGAIVPRLDFEAVVAQQIAVLAESMAGWQADYPDVEIERIVVADSPTRNLIERSRDAQLLVVGSRGRGGFASLQLGSTSQADVHGADCPVVVIRPE